MSQMKRGFDHGFHDEDNDVRGGFNGRKKKEEKEMRDSSVK